jgi:hypothetical protein
MRSATASRLTPVLAAILAEGVADGTFSLADPEGSASVVTSLMLALNEAAVRLFLGRRAQTVPFETATRTLAAYAEALERILGIPAGSWPLLAGARPPAGGLRSRVGSTGVGHRGRRGRCSNAAPLTDGAGR